MDFTIDFPTNLSKDLISFVTGKKLGVGIGRNVYEWPFDPKYVLKIESTSMSFQNVREYEIWQEIQYRKDIAKWFAPCDWISPCGIYMLQRKTEQIPQSEYPQKVPSFFFDQKYSNFGVIVENGKRRFVAHDYGTFSLTNGLSGRFKKADWYKE